MVENIGRTMSGTGMGRTGWGGQGGEDRIGDDIDIGILMEMGSTRTGPGKGRTMCGEQDVEEGDKDKVNRLTNTKVN